MNNRKQMQLRALYARNCALEKLMEEMLTFAFYIPNFERNGHDRIIDPRLLEIGVEFNFKVD